MWKRRGTTCHAVPTALFASCIVLHRKRVRQEEKVGQFLIAAYQVFSPGNIVSLLLVPTNHLIDRVRQASARNDDSSFPPLPVSLQTPRAVESACWPPLP